MIIGTQPVTEPLSPNNENAKGKQIISENNFKK